MRLIKPVAVTVIVLSLTTLLAYKAFEAYARKQLKLDVSYPTVMTMPTGALIKNQPAYNGPLPSATPRPPETYNFPVEFGENGPAKALFAGANQYPFMCQSIDSGLGQPKVDNHDGIGTPVFKETNDGSLSDTIIGYSKDCLLNTRLHYFYSTEEGGIRQTESLTTAVKETAADDSGELLVRVETGTINRFIYALILPTTANDEQHNPDLSAWNGRLVYHFKGAIGIGFQQGKARLKSIIRDMRPALDKGYAIAYSTGNETDNHYNIWLQEDTALRVKKQFTSRYGDPEFTIAMGDSGGALQQYLLSQNNPELLDGGVAIVAYPDMTSQILYGLDCPLLEYYFDYLAADKTFWEQAEHRSLVAGLSFNSGFKARGQQLENIASWMRFETPPKRRGATECSYSWRGSVQMVNNPRFSTHYSRYSEQVMAQNYWTHWQDNRDVYGTDEHGRAPVPWSNVGVQYGLQAWKDGSISQDHFFDLNRKIGSWVPQAEMKPEKFWLVSNDDSFAGLRRFNPYQHKNFSHGGKTMALAPRLSGSLNAAKGAWRSGNMFHGALNMPLIDVRVYRDDILDIHHSWAAVSSRQRILDHNQGNNPLQAIWMAERNYKQIRWDAFAAMEEWLESGASNKATFSEDRCVNKDGDLIAQGPLVWDGDWNNKTLGECSQRFPFNRSSRQVAGDSAAASTLFCNRISITDAVRVGIYDPLDVTDLQPQLEEIFPHGVCDYRQPDQSGLNTF
jgi:hypothetical protein